MGCDLADANDPAEPLKIIVDIRHELKDAPNIETEEDRHEECIALCRIADDRVV